MKAIVAGRDAAKLGRIASETGLERRGFELDDPAAIDSALNRVAVVLNCAGPFKYTAEPLVAACLRSGAHYLDITGEIPVFQAMQAKDAHAKARGVMLLPGVGFERGSDRLRGAAPEAGTPLACDGLSGEGAGLGGRNGRTNETLCASEWRSTDPAWPPSGMKFC